MSSESVSEAFAAIFMRWCMAAHIATVAARINAGDQTITYYVTVSIYRTRQNSPTSQYVLFNKLSNIEPPPRRCTTAR